MGFITYDRKANQKILKASEMKKIAIICYFHEEPNLCLAKALGKAGYKVDFYLVDDVLRSKGYQAGIEYKNAMRIPGLIKLDPKVAPEIVNYYKGLPVRLFLFRLISFSPKLLFINRLIIKYCVSAIKRQKYDVINIVGQNPWLIYFYNELHGENIVDTIHEVGSHQDGVQSTSFIDFIIKKRIRLIFPSESTRQRFMTIRGSDNCKTTVIPLGIYTANLLYKRNINLHLNIEAGKIIFLFYGYLKPYKGLDMLKEAFLGVKKTTDNFYLIIAGAGSDPNIDFFKSQTNCMVMNRFLTDGEMMQLNDIADVVLLPYKSASQSGIVPVSFMFGNPVIATNVGAMPEYIKNGENGIIVPKNDAIAFSYAMLKLLNDEPLLEHLRQGAKEFGHGDRFDWKNIAKETLKFYFT